MNNTFSHYIDESLTADGLFEKFTNNSLHERIANSEEIKYNYCPDCNTPMELSISEYQCKQCGLTKRNDMGELNKNHESTSNALRIGTTKGRYYTVNNDYSRTQYNVILSQLKQRLALQPGAFPINILNATAEQYNSIQKFITEDEYDESGNIKSQKKFVRRGSIKDEVLAAILKFECIREKLTRKNKDIAKFMNLPTEGFARGEDFIRDLEAMGKIDLPVNEEPIEGFIGRYLETLGLDNSNYDKFINELVNRSEDRKLGMNSQISSKVVGAIWIVIQSYKLNITARAVEKAADNTKKNTFTKFYNIVINNYNIFADIFEKYHVPRPC